MVPTRIFPLSNSINIDKKIISELPIKDQLNLREVNKKARQILSNEYFKEAFCKCLDFNSLSEYTQCAFSMNDPERTTPPTWYLKGCLKLNRAIQQIIATHPNYCYILICKVLFNPKCQLKVPKLKEEEIVKLNENFNNGVSLEIDLLENKNTKICGKGHQDTKSLIHKMYCIAEKAEKEISIESQDPEFFESKEYLSSYPNLEILSIVDTRASFPVYVLLDYDSIDCFLKNAQEEINSLKSDYMRKIESTMHGKGLEMYKIFVEKLTKIMQLALCKRIYPEIEQTRVLNNKLISILKLTSNEKSQFFEKHTRVIECLKDWIQLIECRDSIEKMHPNTTDLRYYDFMDSGFDGKKNDKVKCLINSCSDKTRGEIWGLFGSRMPMGIQAIVAGLKINFLIFYFRCTGLSHLSLKGLRAV